MPNGASCLPVLDAASNEQRLWHGTGAVDPRVILDSEVGLDFRFSKEGFYGNGLYLAEKVPRVLEGLNIP